METQTLLDRFRNPISTDTFRTICALPSLVLLAALSAVPVDARRPGSPTVELEDSRGQVVADELTIGRSLFAGISGAAAGETYRFRLADSRGNTVDEVRMTVDRQGVAPKGRLFFKSNIWADGCRPTGGTGLGGPEDVLGPFSSLSEASAELDGMPLWLSAELEIPDPAGKSSWWSTVMEVKLTLVKPKLTVYYWSAEDGTEKCLFDSNEDIFLSVYNGHLEKFDSSRVFLLHRPPKEDWQVGYEFDEVRYREGCIVTPTDDCSYAEGSVESLPDTQTIPMRGLLPKEGEFIAIIRGKEGPRTSKRYPCDRSTEGVLWIERYPDLTDNQEGWGCPPCPNLDLP